MKFNFDLNNLPNKLTNSKTILAILAQIIIIGQTLKLKVDWNAVEIIVGAVVLILINLGILNVDGMQTSSWDDKNKPTT